MSVWPDESAIGRRVRMPDYIKPPNLFQAGGARQRRLVRDIGVVGDTPNVGLHEPPAPSIYVPYTLMLSDSLNVILRTSHDPLVDDPIDSGGGAYRRSQSTREACYAQRKTRWQARVGPVSGS